ncbi:MAG: glycoside hydrolase family 3 C-terminal domain-containing protein [Mogibacterium sp.]|nr:glycoside hydrolase family 3 C-terminal domain-containing protein [Mogibacterium sp.]
MQHDIKDIISKMTLEEKAGMCSGFDFWHFKGVERLGVPSIMVSDGPHGLRKQDESGDHLGINDSIKAVCFPPAVLSACSFDSELMEAFGDRIGIEAQATDLAVVLGPGVNMKRSPLCGRNFEYFSEDPYLAGMIGTAFIKGVQKHNIGTSIKHFAANNQELNRMTCSSDVDERTMREIYLPAFEKAVREARPYTVMCSYNKVNGTFASENEWLLTKVLRDEWGFEGMVMSDWGAVNERVPGLAAGLEVEMPASGGVTDAEIAAAVREGKLDEAVLDRAVGRILKLVFNYAENREDHDLDLEGDHEFAKKVAEESMVLLKNDGILPLGKDEKVLFVGEYAVNPRYQGGGSSHINSFKVTNALSTAEKFGNVTYVKGFSGQDDVYEEDLAREALEAAAKADKVVIFAGLPDSFESEGYDRNHMDMPSCQNRLISEIAAVNSNVAVVLHNGAPVTLPWLGEVRGLLEAYLGGQAGGEAVAEILYGKVNPSGKLAETWPVKLSDNPSYLNFGDRKKVEYHEGIFIGYRYYDKKEMAVNFPFGYGLSYTDFEYSNLRTDKAAMTDGGCITVSVDVTNTGDRAGKESVQFYVADKTGGDVQRPVRELKGFGKVSLEPGETKTVSAVLDDRAFSWYSVELGDWYAFPGEYEIAAGASSRDIRLTTTVRYETSRCLPVEITYNSTVGDLLKNPVTAPLGKFVADKMNHFFGIGEDDDSEAINDAMAEAIAASQPLRSVVNFGILTRDELDAEIAKFNN